MVTTSSNRGYQVPTNAGDVGVWGLELIAQAGSIDAILGGTVTLPSSTFGNNATLTSSQAQIARVSILNTSSQAFQLNLPASNFALGNYDIAYSSSQGLGLTVTAGSSGTGGTSVGMPAGMRRMVFADGVNITTTESNLPTSSAAVLTSSAPLDIAFAIDGGGAVITSGVKLRLHIPVPFTITKWFVMADQVGSITIDIWRANNAVPLSSQSIVGGGNAPALSGAQFVGNTAPSGWTSTTLAADDWLAFNVSSGSSLASVTQVTLALTVQRI